MKKNSNINIARWLIGSVIFVFLSVLIIFRPLPFLFYPKLPFLGVVGRSIYIIILACAMCLYRVWRGPTGADRIAAVNVLGILIVGFCSVLTISTGRPWYIDIAIAWSLQSFISTLALSKYLEGKGFDE